MTELDRPEGSQRARVNEPLWRTWAARFEWLQAPVWGYGVALSLLGAFALLRWPIIALDTDLWYHLTGGRFIVEHHALPTTSFFSFLGSAREQTNYYWLFQTLVYSLHQATGYYGLVALRATVYLATLLSISRFLAHACHANRSRIYFMSVLMIYALFFIDRAQLVRPHLFSYLFIVVFVSLFERRGRLLWLAPPVAILWFNLHGIEFPIAVLIAGSYLLEWIATHRTRRRPSTGKAIWFLGPAALVFAALLATPAGGKLLTLPFTTTWLASSYILEFTPLSFQHFSSLQVSRLMPSSMTCFNIVLGLAMFALYRTVAEKRFRLSHFLLLAGGGLLLTRGFRFTHEFLLLALPLIASNAPGRSAGASPRPTPAAAAIALTLLVVIPIMSLRILLTSPQPYPLSHRLLPEGVATFLNAVDASGPVLNHPDTGGYLEWRLSPRYRIFMDMQIPFLFTDEDMFLAKNMYVDAHTLRRAITTYHPAFITVPLSYSRFVTLIQDIPDYVPVFVDDVEVLYADRRRHPALAAQFQLTLNPFTLGSSEGLLSLVRAEDRTDLLRQVHTLLSIYPDGLSTNQFVAIVYNEEGAYDRALPFAETIIRNFPESRTGYGLKGDALRGLRAHHEALQAYREALRRSTDEGQADIYRAMGRAYLALQQYPKAYQALKRAINPFSPEATYDDLYDLGSSALYAGHIREAALFLRFAAHKVSPEQPEQFERLQEIQRETQKIRTR